MLLGKLKNKGSSNSNILFHSCRKNLGTFGGIESHKNLELKLKLTLGNSSLCAVLKIDKAHLRSDLYRSKLGWNLCCST